MKNVLFIGNSFTYYNDLPAVVTELCSRAGTEIYAPSVTKGGWHLKQYADPENEMGIVLRQVYPEKDWDYVVLQDQSFHPARDPEAALQSVRDLCSILTGEHTLLFYQTWAYKDGSEKLGRTGMDYATMRDKLRDTYAQAARMTGGILVPVGDAFSLCRDKYPDLELYKEDGYHPILTGTYLAACLFTHVLTGLSPLELSGLDGRLEDDVAEKLRGIAAEVL